ncbi:MAG: hypothetical protein AB1765_06410 [Candidatus Hydrogenedentota bacterium]
MRETKYWFWHIVCGFVMLFLLGLHMIIMHLDEILGVFKFAGERVLAFENVASRSKMIGFACIYVLLVGAALYHGLYGLRSMLLELSMIKPLHRLINIGFWILGVILFIVGAAGSIIFIIRFG